MKKHKVIKWIESNCRYISTSDDEIAGKPVCLRKWQKKIIRDVFNNDGKLKKKFLFIQSKRKCGKSAFIAYLLAFLFIDDTNKARGKKMPIVSGRWKQTREIFDIIKETIELASNDKDIKIQNDFVYHKEKKNKIFISSSNAKAVFGQIPSPCIVFEECHAWEDKGNKAQKTLSTYTSGLQRSSSLQIFCMNPADDYTNTFYKNLLKRFRDHKNHPDYSVHIFEAKNPECKIDDKKAWMQADPNLKEGYTLITSWERMHDECEIAKLSLEAEDDFRRNWLGIVLMRKQLAFVDVRKLQILKNFDKLEDLEMSVGLDLSVNYDRTSVCFTRRLPNNRGFLFTWKTFLPEGALGKMRQNKAEKQREYEKLGLLKIQPSQVIDQDEVYETIEKEVEKSNNVLGCFYDPASGGSLLADRVNNLMPVHLMSCNGKTQTPLIQNMERIFSGNLAFTSEDNLLAKEDLNNTMLKYGRESRNHKLLTRQSTHDSIDSSFSALLSLQPYMIEEKIDWEGYSQQFENAEYASKKGGL